MSFSLTIYQPQWQEVFKIQRNTILVKGRLNSVYREITKVAGEYPAKFGCYSWRNEHSTFYCGSFAQDYARGNFKSNLHGRIHNYLQNHRMKKTGHKNTNLMVFENLNNILQNNDISLYVLVFDHLNLNEERVEYASFSLDASLVHAVEELLICSYRRKNQCQWNRT